jgi:outer membrane protein TolC
MRDNHKPDIEFVSGLEKQLTSELRRRQRFSRIERPSGFNKFVKTSILFVACAITGVAAAKTIEHIESSKRRILHVARIEALTEQLHARQSVAQGIVKELEERVDAGLVHEDELLEAAIQSKLVDFELEKALLDLEEVHMSGEAPSNELYAPLQDGRDFVTERLQIDHQRVELLRKHLEVRAADIEKRVAAGLVGREETREIDKQIEGIDDELEDVQRRIDLRRGYLSGDLSAREVSVRQMTEEARSRLAAAESVLRSTEEQLEEISELHAKGLVRESELRQAEYQMITARSECRLAEIELELLEGKLEE